MTHRQSYETLTAAIKARAWCRAYHTKRARWPSVEERVAWIARMFTTRVDVAYVNRACEGMEQ